MTVSPEEHPTGLSDARQFQILVRGVTDYALYMLDPTGIVSSWNIGAERIKGYAAAEIVGRHFSTFYTDEERNAGVPARALETAAHEGRYEAEGLRVRKDGNIFWANVIIDAIRDDEGTLIGFAKITRDITERRATQLAQQATQAQRFQAQKMDALGQLTGGIAHDFNNLLMIVSGYVQTLKRLTADDPKGVRATQAIETAVTRGEALTRQLLSFSRRQMLEPVTIDIAERIDAVRPLLTSSLGVAVRLHASIAPDTWPVKADLNEFELALINLSINARDAMPDGGTIAIDAQNVTLHRDDKTGLDGDFVAISIADTGTGIPEDILPKIFDPFFTTKARDKGTGLGLSQVHGFAHQSLGTVQIESRLGKGTTFTIYLPRTATAREAALDATPAQLAGRTSVLLVEDNPEVAEASASMLAQIGYDVKITGDAASALDAIEQYKFDLIVSDIVMAGAMDGLGLARAIRERHPGLPVLLVTGYSDALALVPSEFTVLRKPYSATDMVRAASRLIAAANHPDAAAE